MQSYQIILWADRFTFTDPKHLGEMFINPVFQGIMQLTDTELYSEQLYILSQVTPFDHTRIQKLLMKET